MSERNMVFKNLDTDDIKYLLGKNREVEEAYCCFYTTKRTAKVPATLPYAYKIDSKAKAEAEKKGEKYIGELMGCDEYFNTRTGNLIYGQVRTSPVIDGEDKNTFGYPNNKQLGELVAYLGANNIKAEKEFIDEQKKESIEKEIISKESVSK